MRKHDTVALIEDGAQIFDFRSIVGDADSVLREQLSTDAVETACAKAGIPLHLRRQAG